MVSLDVLHMDAFVFATRLPGPRSGLPRFLDFDLALFCPAVMSSFHWCLHVLVFLAFLTIDRASGYSCNYTDNSLSWDLYGLRNPSNDYEIAYRGTNVFLNLCGPLLRTCNNRTDAAACMVNGTTETVLGSIEAVSYAYDTAVPNQLSMYFAGGDRAPAAVAEHCDEFSLSMQTPYQRPCKNNVTQHWSFYVIFHCQSGPALPPTIDNVGVPSVIFFEWSTLDACPVDHQSHSGSSYAHTDLVTLVLTPIAASIFVCFCVCCGCYHCRTGCRRSVQPEEPPAPEAARQPLLLNADASDYGTSSGVVHIRQPEEVFGRKLENVPDKFICPITQDCMLEPVALTICAHVFEKTAIQFWLKNHRMCPLCRMPASGNDIQPDYDLAAEMLLWATDPRNALTASGSLIVDINDVEPSSVSSIGGRPDDSPAGIRSEPDV
eukprot:TRINITY_DN1113_c0_g2_i1.p1 TRINITY_DN1113_c0_g2~~TRINITY_DN1113_c0_g2_i1.p1  ORF type:complete len:434 (-),score=92.53 TRINITY_DN1113_c0_g2_i1:1648-2949(-)